MSPVNNHVPFQHLRGTAAAWTSNNPVLLNGETGYETDTGFTKIGNGTSAWNSLNYTQGTPLTVVDGGTPSSPGTTVLDGGAP